jgi:hypothetical protein
MRKRPSQSKAAQSRQSSRPESFWKRIHRAWYTAYRVPLIEENDCSLAQSKSFLSRHALSMRAGVLMQQWPVTVSRNIKYRWPAVLAEMG